MPEYFATSFHPPAEILQDIFSYLSRRDLVNVINVNKWHASNARMVLYRSVVLRNDDPHVDETLSLLYRNQDLSSRILHAVLTTRPRYSRTPAGPWFRPDFLEHSVNLRSLELRGFPFSEPLDREKFNDILRRCCRKLKCFTYRPMVEGFPRTGFELVGLTRVAWHTELELQAASLLATSIATLTHISFLGSVVHIDGNTYEDFLRLKFPHLTSLGLGSLIQSNPHTDTTVTRFLLEHRSIEHLSLGRRRQSDVFFQLQPQLIPTSFLPRLKSFEGFPQNLTVLIRCQVRSIFSITYLSLRSIQSGFADMQELCDALEHAQEMSTFETVKHLRFMFDVSLSHLEIATTMDSLSQRKWMNWLGHVCPNTVTWCGILPPMHAKYLGSMFEAYRNLEVVSLPQTSLMCAQPLALVEYFRPLVDTCPKLRLVIGRKPLYSEIEDHIYTLIRDPNFSLVSVTMEGTRDTSIWGFPGHI